MRHALFAAVSAVVLACASPAPARDPAAADIVQTAARAGQFRTLLNCLIAADLLDAVRADGPFTVFAPTDAAFEKLPKGTLETLLKPENKDQLAALLKYHVTANAAPRAGGGNKSDKSLDFSNVETLTGEPVAVTTDGHGSRVNGVPVRAQVPCRNGRVLVIDQVLTPPAKATIPAVAKKAGQFNTLLAALTAADLADVLSGAGPFTVFAPTDEAFGKLPRGTVAALLKPENKAQLVSILKYHVVAGKVSAKDAVAAGTAKTLQGESVTAAIVDGRLTINKSAVIKSDVAADNGVIHIIDTVLIPKH
jgi:uncharacterized surface protein with fasciclin (FAS1) repeats